MAALLFTTESASDPCHVGLMDRTGPPDVFKARAIPDKQAAKAESPAGQHLVFLGPHLATACHLPLWARGLLMCGCISLTFHIPQAGSC